MGLSGADLEYKRMLADADIALGTGYDGARLEQIIDEKLTDSTQTDAIGFNVKDYGAEGDGVTDDTVSINAAIDAATVDGGVVVVPPGTYIISGQIAVKSNVTLRGAGMGTTILKSSVGAAATELVRLVGITDVTVENLTIDTEGRSGMAIVTYATNQPDGIVTRHTIRRCFITHTTNNTIRAGGTLRDYLVEDCVFDTCDRGVAVYAPSAAVMAGGGTSEGITIRNNTFVNVSANGIEFVGNTQRSFTNVLVTENIMRDHGAGGAFGPIPMEINWCDGVVISNNIIDSGSTRGIGCAQGHEIVISGNTVRGQTSYAFEMGTNDNYLIDGNVVEDCAALVHNTGGVSSNGIISNNVYKGSGASAPVVGGAIIKLNAGDNGIAITGNTFKDWQYLAQGLRISDVALSEDISVTDNTFTVTDANTPLNAVNIRLVKRAVVSGNTFRIKRALAVTDDVTPTIQVNPNSGSEDCIIENNDIIFTADTSLAPNVPGIGHSATAAAPLTGLRILRNRVLRAPIGIYVPSINSTDLRVIDNDTRTCTTVDNVPSTALVKRTSLTIDGTAPPTTGTWIRGDRVLNSSATSTSAVGWVCTVSGTPGTWGYSGEPTLIPQTGTYLGPRGTRGTPTSVLDRLNAIPIYLPVDRTVTRIGCEVTTAVAATVIRLGIYNMDLATGLPSTLVIDAGTIDSSTIGTKEITISQALPAGWYALAAVAQGGTPNTRGLTTASPFPIGAGTLTAALSAQPPNGWVKTGVSGVLPNPYGSPSDTAGNPILVVIKI